MISFNLLQNSYIILNSLINLLWNFVSIWSLVFEECLVACMYIQLDPIFYSSLKILKMPKTKSASLEIWRTGLKTMLIKSTQIIESIKNQEHKLYKKLGRANTLIHKVTLSSPCLWASFDPLSPLSVVSAKQRHFY